MGRFVKKSHLSEIRELVNTLSDRDIKVKRDIRLFEEFFENFPIPVSIWSVTKEGTVVSQRGNGLICSNAKCIETLFDDFEERDNYVDAHRKSLNGEAYQGITSSGARTFFVSLAPRRDEKGNVSGVIGLAWDVTPNQNILASLEKIANLSDNDDLATARKEAQKAIETSRLHKLLKSQETKNASE